MVTSLAAVGAKKIPKPSSDNAMGYLIAGVVGIWLLKSAADFVWGPLQGIGSAVVEVADQVNIVPETKEFMIALRHGATTGYTYSSDQTGSPNPPDREWWELFAEQEGPDAYWTGPIRVQDGLKPPTAAILDIEEPSTAETLGGAAHNVVTGEGFWGNAFIHQPVAAPLFLVGKLFK